MGLDPLLMGLLVVHNEGVFMNEKTFSLTPQAELRRNQSLLSSEIDEDLIMMDSAQNSYFCLNPVGKTIWELLEKPLAYASLLAELTQIYAIDQAQCQQDIEPFLQEMFKHHLIQAP